MVDLVAVVQEYILRIVEEAGPGMKVQFIPLPSFLFFIVANMKKMQTFFSGPES
jgi:hypothetical protein